MNYLKIYQQLFDRAKLPRHLVHKEDHHYIPKSIFAYSVSFKILGRQPKSLDSKSNLGRLSPREHFLAHLLLVKIFKNKNKNCYQRMLYAAHMFNTRGRNNSRKYEWLRIQYIKEHTQRMLGKPSRAKGYKWTAEQLKNKPSFKGKTYTEIYGEEAGNRLKELRKSAKLGGRLSEKTKDKLRKPKSLEQRAKASAALKKTYQDPKHKQNMLQGQAAYRATHAPRSGFKMPIKAKQALLAAHIGKRWVTNGVINKLIAPTQIEEFLAGAYRLGKTQYNRVR